VHEERLINNALTLKTTQRTPVITPKRKQRRILNEPPLSVVLQHSNSVKQAIDKLFAKQRQYVKYRKDNFVNPDIFCLSKVHNVRQPVMEVLEQDDDGLSGSKIFMSRNKHRIIIPS
jgi:hypothetical protein